jgi:hypothetical protein
MLPVPDQRFSGKWYTIEIDLQDLAQFILDFEADPETFVHLHFGLDTSQLKSAPVTSTAPSLGPNLSPGSNLNLSVMDALKGVLP